MKTEIVWSDLIIEEGKLDPLGVWRVGDRLIGELLSAFTTVVYHRPARYFSMYSWIIYHLNAGKYSNRKLFWERFYELEAMLLCAIQLHGEHNYEYFRGQIGSEHAKQILAKVSKGQMNFSKERMSNGWETNYKRPMYDFNLVETDFGMISGLKTTPSGKKLALAYGDSIRSTRFFREFIDKTSVPVKVLEELASYSCPCLTHTPDRKTLENEQQTLIEYMLDTGATKDSGKITEESKLLLPSIYLILDFVAFLNKNDIAFTEESWRKALSTHVTKGRRVYSPPVEYAGLFRRWELYNLDSLFVFALESALNGFLVYLHGVKNPKASGMMSEIEEYVAQVLKDAKIIDNLKLDNTASKAIGNIINFSSTELFALEENIIEKIKTTKSLDKIAYSFLLCVYTTALFIKRQNDDDYKEAVEVLRKNSEIDGLELSVIHAPGSMGNYALGYFLKEIFLKKWIIHRQLDIRNRRDKDVAWFSFNSETNSYNWESFYEPNLYRASRSEILMTFLLNLEIVKIEKMEWVLNRSSSFCRKIL